MLEEYADILTVDEACEALSAPFPKKRTVKTEKKRNEIV